MNFFSPLRPLLRDWLISLAAFGLVAFIHVGQFAMSVSLPLDEALRMAGRDWLPWALIAPLLFRLVARLPLVRGRLAIALPVHVAVALAVLFLCSLWSWTIWPPMNFRAPQPTKSPPENLRLPPPAQSLPPSPSMRPPGPPPGPFFLQFGFRLPIYLGLLSLAHALYFYRRSQEREKRSLELEAGLAIARLEALRMQLQPHFLFNSLNAIAELVHRDPAAADAMLVALSSLLRLTLETSGEQEIPLHREMEFINRYLAIEHVRLGDRAQVEIDLPEETRHALVPTFLLQPLVENSIRHGLEPRGGIGLLEIRARREDDTLCLVVADNGVGLPASAPREGIGLSNTRARLHALHGNEASLVISGPPGMIIKITLPFRTRS